ncbi:MAG: hypothetical protein R3246_16265, partial [Acidimicrobiia bacterium]|nr:hypothetical protein [Acidimicrobiia bacterium]
MGDDSTDPDPQGDAIVAAMTDLLADVPCQADVDPTTTSANLLPLHLLESEIGGLAEIDMSNDTLLTAVAGGFNMVDISDPQAPLIIGQYLEDSGRPLDVKFSPDNMTALYGRGHGIEMVDIRDPQQMTHVGSWLFGDAALPGANAHMLDTARIAGQDWVFLAPNTNTGIWIFKLNGPPDARELEFVTQTLPVQGGVIGPHDMVVHNDRDLGWVLYSADGFHGWSAWDINDPASPQRIGGLWKPESGYLHTIQAGYLENTRVVVTSSEVGGNLMQVFDATDLAAPVLLAVWATDQAGGAASPQHNFNVVDNFLYIAHYGVGVLIFDLTPFAEPDLPLLATMDLAPVAVYRPSSGGGYASFWDVVVRNG